MLKWITLDAGSDRERLTTKVNGLTIEVWRSAVDPTVDPVWCYQVSVSGGRVLTEDTTDTLDDAKADSVTWTLMQYDDCRKTYLREVWVTLHHKDESYRDLSA